MPATPLICRERLAWCSFADQHGGLVAAGVDAEAREQVGTHRDSAAGSLRGLAPLYLAQERYEEAIGPAREALSMHLVAYDDPGHPEIEASKGLVAKIEAAGSERGAGNKSGKVGSMN